MIKKVGKLLSVAAVVLVSIAAGLFLTACRKAQVDKPAQKPAAEPAKTSEKPDPPKSPKKEDPKKQTVDVDETEKGSPVPRNLLE